VALGAPAAADDPATGWAELTAWAASALAEREEKAPEAEHAMAAAARDADGARRAAEAAATDLTDRRRALMLAARAEEQARSRLEALDGRIEALRTSLTGAPTATQVDDDLARLDALEAGARTADADLRAARSARAEAEEAVEAVRREVSAGWEALRRARDPLVPLGAPAVDGDDLAAAWTVLTTWAERQTADREARLPGALAAVEAARAESAAQGARLAGMLAVEGVAAGETLPRGSVDRVGGTSTAGAADRTATAAEAGVTDQAAGVATVSGRAAEAAVVAALAHARAVRGRLAERRAEAADKRAEQGEAEEAQQVAKMLGGLLRSDRFPRWLVASALDALVVDASAGLAELSGGQFELAHEDGEFLVVDHADADARRPVKTLSGGETFQASLALALALSAQMSTLAAEGAARLDSIFLDEGFGTLDETNLDVVAGTLENLASRGDRMVGVITHVPGLAERVPVRFAVRRDQRSSRIEREGVAPPS
jgi:DNA repair protein SbcC/Rad50